MVVIALHEHDVWNQATERCSIAVSSVIAFDEARFHSVNGFGFSEKIDLPGDIANGRIVELSATAQDIVRCRNAFGKTFAPLLHDGELECLALLSDDANAQYSFCTADRAALMAAAMLGLAERCVSLGVILASVGLQKSLAPHFTDEWMKKCLDRGRENRMYGKGLSKNRGAK